MTYLELEAQRRNYITMTCFWAFHLFEQVTEVGGVQVREATTILCGGRLLQQLVVDCWAVSRSATCTGACRTYFPRPWTICIDPGSILRDQNKGLIRQPELGCK